MSKYGEELVLTLHHCVKLENSRNVIEGFFIEVCKSQRMERCDLHWWDDLETPEDEKETESHLVGTSAIQFIKTSNITVHTLDMLDKVFINVFTCGELSKNGIEHIALSYFGGKIVQSILLERP